MLQSRQTIIKGLLPAGHITTAPGLEADDDVSDLHVSLLFQMGQHSSPEEHFTLTNTEQVGVQLQGFDLIRNERVLLKLRMKNIENDNEALNNIRLIKTI